TRGNRPRNPSPIASSSGGGKPSGARRFVSRDVVLVAEREADVVEAFQEPFAYRVVEWKVDDQPERGRLEHAPFDVDDEFQRRLPLDRAQPLLAALPFDDHGHESVLRRVVAEDVAEAR